MIESITKIKRRTEISFFRSGKIEINSRIAHLLSLCKGDVVDVAVGNGEVYLYVARRYKEGENVRYKGCCSATNKKGIHFRTYSVDICKAILTLCGAEKLVKLYGGEADTLRQFGRSVPLITSNPIEKI